MAESTSLTSFEPLEGILPTSASISQRDELTQQSAALAEVRLTASK